MQPQYPIYIVSKGRADTRFTVKYLDRIGVPYTVIIEAPEWPAYAAVIDPGRLLVLDPAYQDAYDTCDDLGASKSKGPGAARNYAWAHSLNLGAAWHWVMDDNIRWFCRLHHNQKIRVADGTIFRCMEDFCARYANVGMAGPAYESMTPRKAKCGPVVLNTRIYSCNLIRNDLPFRWRGRYNEDTDLSVRLLKAGWCTVQFNAFLQKKVATQIIKGGCTTDFYEVEGTRPKSEMQVKLHPDCSRLVWRYGRWHHHVDYKRFAQRLILKRGQQIPPGPDEYGMTLVPVAAS
jgi:TET-Associated Glycosyltransferase